jgi:hypothetical protein
MSRHLLFILLTILKTNQNARRNIEKTGEGERV